MLRQERPVAAVGGLIGPTSVTPEGVGVRSADSGAWSITISWLA